jgi:hypothetical protein
VAVVKSTADRLEGELQRTNAKDRADYQIASNSIARARQIASQPSLELVGAFPRSRRLWRRFGSWWTGDEVDQAWAALHTAGQALLSIESPEVVKAQLGDIAANLVITLSPGDLRLKDYMTTLELLANPDRTINDADRAQLRAIRQASDSSSDSGHADARAFRNTLILVGSLLAIVLAGICILGLFDSSFRSVLPRPKGTVISRWYFLEIEALASLAGVTGAVLSLQNYSGFQFTYGLPIVQAFLKGGTGAATGLFGVFLVQSGILSVLKVENGAAVFAVAIIFGYAQYLFTRLVDQQAAKILGSASSRNDPGTVPEAPTVAATPTLVTTSQTS